VAGEDNPADQQSRRPVVFLHDWACPEFKKRGHLVGFLSSSSMHGNQANESNRGVIDTV
jgi:hypothetical protein